MMAAACSEPACRPGEVRIGMTCHAQQNLVDGSADMPRGAARLDAAAPATEDASLPRDGAFPRPADAASSQEPSPTGDPDAILDELPLGPPSFQFRADAVTLSGTRVTSLPNRRGSDALVVSPSVLVAPVSDAAFAGAPSLVFSGTEWLDSNLPPSSWTFLHDGSGAEVFVVYRPGNGDGQTLVGTARQQDTISTCGASTFIDEASDTTQVLVANGGNPRPVDIAPPLALAAGVATYTSWQLGGPGIVHAVFDRDRSVSALTALAAKPCTTPPAYTLRLGANAGTHDRGFRGAIAELLIFERALREEERRQVRAYIAARYGIAPER
ncbi:MAG TPA: hypothetical protein VI299_09900 [Polyangiales bacterium]